MSIKLTKIEEDLFRILKEFASSRRPNTTMRVAGGWVRDKLLGLASSDIDIALDNCTGKTFAESLANWWFKRNKEPLEVVILAARPEMSKHLETARVVLGESEIDFVNLRTETYTELSRVPTANDFGTPLEDARRRDFTINSLFYNLNTNKVEDLIGQGIKDLRSHIIRTPISAKETFSDDPLRGLRAIRFSSRFHFRLDRDIVVFMKNPKYHELLSTKVSFERCSKEVQAMLTHGNCVEAFNMLNNFGIWNWFLEQCQVENFPKDFDRWEKCLEAYSKNISEDSNLSVTETTNERLGHVMAALTWPISDLEVKIGSKKTALSQIICLDIKFPNKSSTSCSSLQQSAKLLISAMKNRDQLLFGQAILAAGDFWKYAVHLAASVGPFNFNVLQQEIEDRGLEDFQKNKKFFNGSEIRTVLPRIPHGPSIKIALDKQTEFQILNTNESKDSCARFLREQFPNWAHHKS